MSKSILELSHKELKQHLLETRSYFSEPLPDYIDFSKMLKNVSQLVGRSNTWDNLRSLADLDKGCYPPEGASHVLFANKDNLVGWRPLTLINPIIYVTLVNLISNEKNWGELTAKFNENISKAKSVIKCVSVPKVGTSAKENTEKDISNWWEEFEQESIKLSMEYQYMLSTDISSCYPSIYTHAIGWALHGKDVMKNPANRKNKLGTEIDTLLASSQYGQTNGIPQGSRLSDLIAELVLSWVDVQITMKLSDEQKSNLKFRILRYRDDYRVFSNSPEELREILKIISDTLQQEMSMHLNSSKTVLTDNVIKDSIKEDKLYSVFNMLNHAGKNYIELSFGTYDAPIFRYKSLQKELLLIYQLSLKFPNSGSVSTSLDYLYRNRIVKLEKLESYDDVDVLVSIVTEIMFRNPRVYGSCVAIISKLLSLSTKIRSRNKIKATVEQILSKFSKTPSTGLLQIWLQRMILSLNVEVNEELFKERFCARVFDDKGNRTKKASVWNSDWLNEKSRYEFDDISFTNTHVISELTPVFSLDEVSPFSY